MPGHYRVFISAARALASGHEPYGTDFGTGVGDYFYSPACGLYFFRLFAGYPEHVGLFLYMALSIAVFVVGAAWALRVFSRAAWGENPPDAIAQLFWVAVAPQVYSGILASKVELIMTGILFLAVAWVAERRWLVLSGFLSAMITNWKFQPLPVMGLLVLAWLTGASFLPWRKRLKWPLAFVGGLVFWSLVPALEMGWATFAHDHAVWVASFSPFVRESYLNFENVFALASHAFGLTVSYRDTQLLTLAVGLALALNLLAWIRWVHPEPAWPWVSLIALGSGTIVMTGFSPLGQNNAMVLYSPLVLGALLRMGTSRKPKLLLVIFGLLWVVCALSYSDLTPIVIREEMRYLSAKAGACCLLGAVWIALCWRVEWMRMLNERAKMKIKPSRALFCGVLAVFALGSLTRCGSGSMSDISQDHVYTQYGLSYDDGSKTVIASAIFTAGNALGPRLTLDEGAYVHLGDGTKLQEEVSQPDGHVFYQAILNNAGSAADTGTKYVFDFVDTSGDEYDNSVSFNGMVAVGSASTADTEFSLSTGSSAGMTATPPLVAGERIEVHVRQDGGKGTTINHVEKAPQRDADKNAGDGMYVTPISAAELSPFSQGPGFIRICRILDSNPTQHAKAGGKMTTSACSAEQSLNLTQ